MQEAGLGKGPVFYTGEFTPTQYRKATALVRSGVLLRIGTGIVVEHRYWEGLSGRDRSRGRVALTAKHTGFPLVGRAAALMHDLPLAVKDVPVELGSRGRRRTRDVIHRQLNIGLEEHFLTWQRGIGEYRLSDITRTCIDVARWYPLAEAVSCMDHALRQRLTSRAALERYVQDMRGFDGISAARTAVSLATPWSESPRESLVKVEMFQAGLPAPLQQVEIYDHRGDLLGRLDFFFEDISLAVEYDGAGKHNGQFGIDPLIALRSEFARHGLLTHEGLLVFRLNSESFTHRQGMSRLIEQHRRMSTALRPYPPHLMKAAGRAWREE